MYFWVQLLGLLFEGEHVLTDRQCIINMPVED